MSLLLADAPKSSDEAKVRSDGVACVDSISSSDFYRNYIRRNQPLVMTGMMHHWKAMHDWSFEYFRSMGSQSSVHIEEGNVMQDSTNFRKQSFCDYMSALIDGDVDSNGAYLSVFRIFDEFPHLRNDVDFSVLNDNKLKHSTVGWLGPAGTITGYHIDWGDNILAQIHGRKEIHLAAPADTPNMYPSRKFDQGATISEVNLHNWDPVKHPKFARVKHQKAVLQPRQMLFIPRGWWHQVRSLDKSISVSNITYDLKGLIVDALGHRCKQILHDLGLWKCECTCHVRREGKWVRK